MKPQTDDLISACLIENYARFYRLAYSYVQREADAMDIVQEGAYKAILNSGSLKNINYIQTWIYRIMINEALAFIKKNKITYEPYDTIEQSSSDVYEDIDLKKTIENLGEPDKTIIKLRFFEDMKLEQIAGILGENLNTTKSKLYRALKTMKLSLEE